MTAHALTQIAILLAVASSWLLVNLKAGTTWLKTVSLLGLLGFLGAASWLALAFAGIVP